jgi:hypothetical protein
LLDVLRIVYDGRLLLQFLAFTGCGCQGRHSLVAYRGICRAFALAAAELSWILDPAVRTPLHVSFFRIHSRPCFHSFSVITRVSCAIC